jgi:hypothetical protein
MSADGPTATPPAPAPYAPWATPVDGPPAPQAPPAQPHYKPAYEDGLEHQAKLVHVPKGPGVLPWIFVGLGFFIPLSALLVGIYGVIRLRDDGRYFPIALCGFGMLFVPVLISLIAVS